MSKNSTQNQLHVALVGNPNSGKSTLFNSLTGLNQKIGNFPGVTVDKKMGELLLDTPNGKIKATLIDLPGTYSLYPKSIDEEVAFQALCDPENEHFPDLTVIVADATNLKRSLFLCSQIIAWVEYFPVPCCVWTDGTYRNLGGLIVGYKLNDQISHEERAIFRLISSRITAAASIQQSIDKEASESK